MVLFTNSGPCRIRGEPDFKAPPAFRKRTFVSVCVVLRNDAASDHRDELALGVGVAVDISLSCLNGPMPGQ
jgi:hypothetical protein